MKTPFLQEDIYKFFAPRYPKHKSGTVDNVGLKNSYLVRTFRIGMFLTILNRTSQYTLEIKIANNLLL